MVEDAPVLAVDDVTMSFGANQVLAGVSLAARRGRVLALMGANGAGKSTLIKILSGVHPRTGGTIDLDGRPFAPSSPLTARRAGIQTVHQRIDEGIVPGLSVAENLLFDRMAAGRFPVVASPAALLAQARGALARLGLDWTTARLRMDVDDLAVADQQLVVVARALADDPALLILDEPTSALSALEADRLFEVIDRLRAAGTAVIYVSHRLGEIDRIADDLVVLRDGRIRGRYTPPFAWEPIVRDMLGEGRGGREAVAERRGTEAVLQLSGLRLLRGSEPLDLDVRAGEVTGVIGLIGAGKSELARAVFGAEPTPAGSMRLAGRPYRPRSPHQAIARGVYLVPEDRAAMSMVPRWSLAQTVSLPFLRRVSRWGLVREAAERSVAQTVVDRFDVRATSVDQPLDALSGGNQQKVVVGRWLERTPRVMILDEPFRGVDIGARHDISRRCRELAAGDAAVLVLCSDIDEVLDVADRVLVLVDGQVRMDMYTSQVSRDEIVTTMSEVA